MPKGKRGVLKLGRNPGRVPTNVNKTGKPPGAKSLDGKPVAKQSSSGSDGGGKA